jgi:hypothetical protein
MKKPDRSSPEKEILKTFEAAGLVEYLEYLQSGKRIMMTNFKAGIAKGLGLTLGMSLVLGIIAWVVALLVDLPVVGEYAREIENYMNEYRESTNYTDEFNEMNELLRHIDENTRESGAESETSDIPGETADPNEAPQPD